MDDSTNTTNSELPQVNNTENEPISMESSENITIPDSQAVLAEANSYVDGYDIGSPNSMKNLHDYLDNLKGKLPEDEIEKLDAKIGERLNNFLADNTRSKIERTKAKEREIYGYDPDLVTDETTPLGKHNKLKRAGAI